MEGWKKEGRAGVSGEGGRGRGMGGRRKGHAISKVVTKFVIMHKYELS